MDTTRQNSREFAGLLTALGGIWLTISPMFFNVTGQSFWYQIVAGVLLIVFGFGEAAAQSYWPSSISGLVGLWLVISPFVFNLSSATFWNQIITGVAVLVLATVDSWAVNKMHHAQQA